ncbi:MAG: Hsp20/alpha crystallin family protein [bacterium]
MTQIVLRDPLSFLSNWNRLLDGAPSYSAFETGWKLPLDISQTDSEVIVRAAVPGYAKEEVDIEVHEGVLTIKAEKAEGAEEEGERFYHRERRSGAVSRRVSLSDAVDEAGARATLKDGVLTVRLPLSEEEKPRKVAIQ